jgi:hypothetical protein
MKAFFLFISTIVTSSFFVSCGSKGDENVSKDSTVLLYSEFHDFESSSHVTISADRAFSGKKSSRMTPDVEYGLGVNRFVNEVPSFGSVNRINVSIKSWMDQNYSDATFVFSIDDTATKTNIIWDGRTLSTKKPSEWTNFDFGYTIKKEWLKPEYKISLYVWNKGKNTFFVDNLKVEFSQVIPKL